MEDRHLAVDTPAYGLWGVLDGHAGELAAERAVEEIPRLLDLIWGLYPPKQAFEELCAALGHQLRDERSGTTLVLSLLDKRTGHLYTATLGDSEAFVWRKETGALEPLSCVRSFDRSPDKERAKRVYQQISTDQLNYVEAWETGLKVARERGDKPKVVSLQQVQRLPLARRATTLMQALLNSTCGLTMPRALGDGEYREFMSIEPDVTITAVGPGDVVLMGSDGVTDYIGALRPWVQEILKTDVEMDRVAQEGVQQALAQGPPGEADNVTLIAIRAERAGGGV
jgi:serine/threonine protein phosphatase PrpC